ncbi:MAG: zinc ribbon domain-containing protein [Thermoplasmata archaeon]|nr:zinc ribbon domain-containing protein [Thermoplasmata archaeon]MCJ7562015.1 zinc ribbon domain-containing protein [Thermoplasmata archaeon]TFG70101.1 MAG: zinc ribbon domain-containing protein [Methanomassiliicoccus sp.]
MASIKCPKCAAPVTFDAESKFVKCSYCTSQIYIDRSGAGFYYALPYAVSETSAVGMFRRWAAGSTKAKDLDKNAQIAGVKKQYFPVYMFKRDINGKEQVLVEPAGSTTLPGLHNLKVPAGDLKIYDDSFDVGGAELIKPDIEMLSYMDTLPGKPKEQALVFFPIWKLDYVFNQKRYEVIIDGSTGEVFSAEFPTRNSSAYVAVAGIGFVAFVIEGLLAAASLPLALGLMGLTVVGVFASALFVARRM